MANLVWIEGVSLVSRDGRQIFRNLDWNLPEGARMRIHASPGDGASALLRLCAGLADPDQGRVVLDGLPLGPHSFAHPFLKQGGIAWVPRDGGLLVNLSLRANVALPLRFLRGHTRLRADELAQGELEAAGLGLRAEDRPHALDPRERWLGALVRAKASEGRLWLVDVPPAPLDAQQRASAARLLGDAAATGGTSFVIIGQADGGAVAAEEFRIENGHLERGGSA